jgi:tetratricopeptide (TPR) repeat protein
LTIALVACDRYSKDRIIENEGITEAEEMLDYLNDLLSGDPKNPQILFKRAQVYFDHGDTRRSLIDIQKALELKPTDPDFHLLHSRILDKRDDAENCLAAALQAEQRGLRNYELYRILAVNYLKLDDAENAKRSIERLLNFNINGENLSLKGDIFLQLKDTLGAIKSYEQAISRNQELSRPYKELYQINKARNKPVKAETYIDQYLIFNSDNTEFLIFKANLLRGRKVYDSALLYYKLANVMNQEKNFLVDFGNLYFAMSEFDSSLMLARKVIGIDSQYVDAKLLAARSLNKLRSYTDAKEVYESILKYDSTMQIAAAELDILNRKVAYLWRLQKQEKAFDSIRNRPPPPVIRKEIEN